MKTRKYSIKFGEKEKEILELIAAGVLISASLVIPALPIALKPFLKNKYARSNTKKILKRLEEKGVIYLGGERIVLTEKGLKLSQKLGTEDISISIPESWDNIWRLISYDIPDQKKKEREYFRCKLLELGFRKVHESFMIFPYDCKEEIAVFAESLGLTPFVMY